jgi:hypothetical protein
MTMFAFTNTEVTKPQLLCQLRAHAEADQIVKGYYWKRGKGCAVGCTIHGNDHSLYEPLFGIPQMLAHLEDCIFEGLPVGRARWWPFQFVEAIEPGADLSRVGWKFLHWLLTDKNINPGINDPSVKSVIRQCVNSLVPLSGGQPSYANPIDIDVAVEIAEAVAFTVGAVGAVAAATVEANNSVASARSVAESVRGHTIRNPSIVNNSAISATQIVAEGVGESTGGPDSGKEWMAAEATAYWRMSKKMISLIKKAPKAGRWPNNRKD